MSDLPGWGERSMGGPVSDDFVEHMLTLYVIYDAPNDFPASYVVRPQFATRVGVTINPICCIGQDLEVLREPLIEDLLLTRLERQPDDDPAILEVWL